ncbi:MAG TPA: DUF3857 domain-containing protein, partial [Candidatus Angelobacter sp.]|nr:DUF3857 domain-containing protein [Candidatus Angelobacter sp.]
MRAPPIPILLALLLLPGLAPPAIADSWHPIKLEDLALKQGRVDPDADAEAIEWEIDEVDEWSGERIKSSETQYRRIKVFSARGRDAFSRVDIPYSKDTRLEGLAARTIRPDGSVIAVKKDAIMERTVAKGAGIKERIASVAMPGVEPGCIVEYCWTTVRFDQLTHNVRVALQLDVPAEQIRFSIHPLPIPSPEFRMQVRAFNFHMPPFTEEGPGLRSIVLKSMPALKKEPFSPPDMSLRPWLAIYYSTEDESPIENFWRRIGRDAYERSNEMSHASGDVKRLTKAALTGLADQDLIVERLVEYCRTRIRNSDMSDSGLTADDRDWLQSEHPAADHMKRGLSDSYGLLKVFLSMASAAGLDARLALVPDRSECVFTPSLPTHYLLTRQCAAVNVLGVWRAIDPSAADLPPEMLPWEIEGVDMLIADDRNSMFRRTPMSTPEQSLTRGTASLKLSEEGALEGDVAQELTGQEAASWRRELRGHSAIEREQKLIDKIKSRMSTAEVTAIHFDPDSSASEPARLSYHVRVPGYAQKTAQRLIFQPAFFQRGDP